MTLRLGELFAGYGGLGMAVEEVFGATTAWFSEFEEGPSKILAHRWPEVPNHGDITKIDWAEVEPVDIISGGSPCQDLSLAGRRKGMAEGTRSNLWETMREGIAIIRPKYVVWENVRGALSAGAISELEQSEGRVGADGEPNLRAIGRVLGDLADLGYDAEWRGLTASNVGATHGRFRVFLLAALPDARSLGLEARRLPGRPLEEVAQPANHQPVLSHAHSFRCERCGQAWDGRTRLAYHCEPISDTMRGGSGGRSAGSQSARRDDAALRSSAGGDGQWAPFADAGSATFREQPREPLAEEAGARSGHGLADHRGEQSTTDWGPYAPAIRRWERVNGPAPRPTEPTGRDNAHRLSPAFVEWMMGLPAGWVTDVPGVNRNAQLKALGNGVVPAQAAAALRDMLGAFESERSAA